jgi:hypothetical protein
LFGLPASRGARWCPSLRVKQLLHQESIRNQGSFVYAAYIWKFSFHCRISPEDHHVEDAMGSSDRHPGRPPRSGTWSGGASTVARSPALVSDSVRLATPSGCTEHRRSRRSPSVTCRSPSSPGQEKGRTTSLPPAAEMDGVDHRGPTARRAEHSPRSGPELPTEANARWMSVVYPDGTSTPASSPTPT